MLTSVLLLVIVILVSILVQAAKRAKQYKSILNRVAPHDLEYLSMLVNKENKK